MEKVLSLPEDYFEFQSIENKQCFYPKFLDVLLVNALRASVGFEWYPDNNLNFHVRPRKVINLWKLSFEERVNGFMFQGVIPEQTGIFCNLYYTPCQGHDDWTQREITTDANRSFVILVKVNIWEEIL